MNKEFIYNVAITQLCLNTRQCILNAWHQMKRKGLLFCWLSPSNMQEGITYLKCTCCNFHVKSVQYTTSCTLVSFKKIAWLLTQHILASCSLSYLAFIHFTTFMASFLLPTYPTHTHTHIYSHTTPTLIPIYAHTPTDTHTHPHPLHTHTHTVRG